MHKRRMIIWSAVLTAMVAAGLWLSAPEYRLMVRECLSERTLAQIAIPRDSDFAVRFHHSYDRAFFREHYHLEAHGALTLTRMSFKSALNGQGFDLGTYRSLPDGSAELADIDRPVKEIVFRLGSPDLANHTLVLPAGEVRLLDHAQAGDLICITAAAQPRWRRWFAPSSAAKAQHTEKQATPTTVSLGKRPAPAQEPR
ncbi:DUF1850 domain-containing protein [Desulfatitalea alkaliphila]|uniref:DUF1850 domain-containing protein n=1 Tax=Desulfatitalea alkaliphila TaxID=2929485 RepID=A0AA41R2R9_9BACT|nr:DUF1850 domain-containing protein [Desulfatitalea alkaliphila]MCJ8501069.1 DUF1850 domain-containing protein [Desulfatitalea alkaliphila]